MKDFKLQFQLSGILMIASLLIFSSCSVSDSNPVIEVPENKTYLVLGHIYQWGSPHENNRIDHRLEGVDFNKYDGILLGGDVCSEATKFEKTVSYIDDLFDLSNEKTLWSLGNHDARNGNRHWVQDRTGRKLFYTTYFDNVQWLIVNSPFDVDKDNPDPCADMAEQWQLINTVLDTVQKADNLVILMHYVVWGNVEREEMQTSKYANAEKSWMNLVCDSVKHFESDFYPLLLEVAQRGIQIKVISGDGGQKTKRYNYRTKEGIDFYITGINNSVDSLSDPDGTIFNHNPDSVLELQLDKETGILGHEFVPLTKIIQ
jgi:hypothetical protein